MFLNEQDSDMLYTSLILEISKLYPYKKYRIFNDILSDWAEVKIAADKISKVLFSKIKIENITYNKINDKIKNKIIDSYIKYLKTFGKNIIIKFSL